MAPDGTESKRRSFFGALTGLQVPKDESEPATVLRKKRTASLRSSLSTSTSYDNVRSSIASPHSPTSPAARASSSRGNANRASSVFGSFRGIRVPDEDGDGVLVLQSPRSLSMPIAAPTSADEARGRPVLLHGEVQTSSSMFRKKKEYLVLTETHLIRFKSHQKAAETFPAYVHRPRP